MAHTQPTKIDSDPAFQTGWNREGARVDALKAAFADDQKFLLLAIVSGWTLERAQQERKGGAA